MCLYTVWPVMELQRPNESERWKPHNAHLHPRWQLLEDAEDSARLGFGSGEEETVLVMQLKKDGAVTPVWIIGQIRICEDIGTPWLAGMIKQCSIDCANWWSGELRVKRVRKT